MEYVKWKWLFRFYRGHDFGSNLVELLCHSRGKSILFACLGALFDIAPTKATMIVFLAHWPSCNHVCLYETSLNMLFDGRRTLVHHKDEYVYSEVFGENWSFYNATTLYSGLAL